MDNITGYGNNTNKTYSRIYQQGSSTFSIAVSFLVLNIFLAITASLGNALILIALHKVTSIYPPTKLLFRCLAVTDLCVGLIVQPLFVFVTFYPYLISPFLLISFFFCLTVVTLLTSTAISVDRLLSLSMRLRYRHFVTLRRVRVVIVCFLLIGASCVPTIIFTISDRGRAILFNIFFASFILSLVISLCSYMKIVFTLRRHQAQMQQHVQPGQPNGGGAGPLNIARYKKTVFTIALIQLVLLVCYAPFSGMGLLLTHGKISESTAMLITGQLMTCFVFLNSSLNPVLYCWRIKDVRQEVKNTIRKVCCSSS